MSLKSFLLLAFPDHHIQGQAFFLLSILSHYYRPPTTILLVRYYYNVRSEFGIVSSLQITQSMGQKRAKMFSVVRYKMEIQGSNETLRWRVCGGPPPSTSFCPPLVRRPTIERLNFICGLLDQHPNFRSTGCLPEIGAWQYIGLRFSQYDNFYRLRSRVYVTLLS